MITIKQKNMTEKKQRKPGSGGARKNAGAHKKSYFEKKQTIRIYIEGKYVDKFGGVKSLKEKIDSFIKKQ